MPAPLRILYIINALGSGGAERQLLYLLTTLDRSRYELYVVSIYAQPDRYKAELMALNIPVYCLDHGSGVRGRMAAMLRYIRLVWRVRPAIVQGCLHYANLIARVARRFCPPHKLITSARVAYSSNELRSERFTQWLDDGLIVNSLHLRDQMVDHTGRQVRRITIISNGVSLAPFDQNTQPDLRAKNFGGSTFVIGMIGRIARQKDHPTLLNALALVRDQWPIGLQVFFVGETTDIDAQERIDALIAHYQLHSVIRQFPAMADVSAYYLAADLIVLPSLAEGFPNVVLEAFAAGKPVIVSTAANGVGIVEPGISGWQFPTGDTAALARCLILGWKSAVAERTEMGKRAQAVAATYDIPAMATRYIRLYQRLVGEPMQAMGEKEQQ